MTLNDIQRRIRRSKASERRLGHWLLEHDGKDETWVFASSTGRVGHLLQFDVVSMTYAAENKQVRIPANLYKWWYQIVQQAKLAGKQPLLRLEPTNEGKVPDLHIITAERHAELLDYEWKYKDLQR